MATTEILTTCATYDILYYIQNHRSLEPFVIGTASGSAKQVGPNSSIALFPRATSVRGSAQ